MIERWLAAVVDGAQHDWALGYEIAQCGRLIKGYGATNERGKHNLAHIVDHLASGDAFATPAARAAAIREAREAALADEGGKALDRRWRARRAGAAGRAGTDRLAAARQGTYPGDRAWTLAPTLRRRRWSASRHRDCNPRWRRSSSRPDAPRAKPHDRRRPRAGQSLRPRLARHRVDARLCRQHCAAASRAGTARSRSWPTTATIVGTDGQKGFGQVDRRAGDAHRDRARGRAPACCIAGTVTTRITSRASDTGRSSARTPDSPRSTS